MSKKPSQTRVVITDAYSSTNLGDAELVRLTVAQVPENGVSSVVVLATDPNSFTSQRGEEYIYKPFSRLAWKRLNGSKRYLWLAGETVSLVTLAVTAFLGPALRRRTLRRAGAFMQRPWLVALADANLILGVGGGYLGDNYWRETLITLQLYRFGLEIGANVGTMPISITKLSRKTLQWALRRCVGVNWRSRESYTHEILLDLGQISALVPDLAWLNHSKPSLLTRTGFCIAPVGSKFYRGDGERLLPESWSYIQEMLKIVPLSEPVYLLPMHKWSENLDDGRDDFACLNLQTAISKLQPSREVKILNLESYEQVRKILASSRFAICERLHAALAALTTGTPLVVFGYEPKHLGVLKLAGLSMVCEQRAGWPEVSSSQIITAARSQSKLTRSGVTLHENSSR